MPLHDRANWTGKLYQGLASISAPLVGLLITIWLVTLGLPSPSYAEPLDYRCRWTIGFESFLTKIDGRMGFDQQPGGYGTLNDVRYDLGLPQDNQSYRITATIRPLEHHLLRIFGNIPEQYNGTAVLNRELRLTRVPNYNATGSGTSSSADFVIIFPQDKQVSSEMRYAMYGLGYDLDFLVAPTWLAGLNGEFRYVDLRMRIFCPDAVAGPTGQWKVVPPASPSDDAAQYNNTNNIISVDELVPCLGGHAHAMIPFGHSGTGIGAFSRMNFGINPNYVNYVDINMGLSLRTGLNGGFGLMAKVGFEHESIFHDTQNRAGRVMELKRDGIQISLDGTF